MILKVPQSSYRVAKEKGCLTDYLFFLRLKTVNTQGTLPLNYQRFLQKEFNFSPSKAYTRITSLISLGWITRTQNSYSLVSYDKLWTSLGFTIKDNGKGIHKKKIFKIELRHGFSIEELIYYKEIDHNLELQRRQVRYHHSVGRSRKLTDTDKIARKLQKKFERTFDEKERTLLWSFQTNLIRGNQSNTYNGVNYDITLSCEGVAKLFGYQSPAQGYNIQQKLNKVGLLKSHNRKLYIGRGISSDHLESGQYFVSKNNKLLRQLPNLLELL